MKAKQEELARHQPWAVFSGTLHSNPGFLGGSDGKEYTCMWETWVLSLGWEDPLEEGMAIHSSILAGELHGQRSLENYSPWGPKKSDTTE